MANSLFAAYKGVQIGDASVTGFSVVAWESDDCRTILIDTGTDTPAPSTDQDLADITAGARVATSGAMGSKTANLSGTTLTADAADITFSAVTGSSAESILVYRHTGTEATSLLLVYFDTGVTGLPVTPNGGDITLTWNASGLWTW